MRLQQLFLKNKATLIYGASLAILLFFLKWLELRFILFDNAFEIYIGVIALIFTALGIWLALKLIKSKVQTVFVEKEVYTTFTREFVINQKALDELGISKRELEVLQLMAKGYSNQEIATRLFLSLNTIKTHSSNLFEKMDVKRRTQAIEKAKRMSLIP